MAVFLPTTSDYLIVANSAGNTPASAFTVGSWVKDNAGGAFSMRPFCRWGNSSPDQVFVIIVTSTAVVFAMGGAGFGVDTYTATIDPSTWYHVAMTWDGTFARGYVNGVEVADFVFSFALTSYATAPLKIGSDGSATGDACSVAEAFVYSAVLTAPELMALAKGARPPQIRPQSLGWYSDLTRNFISPVGGNAITPTGSPVVAPHPRIYG